MANIELQDSNSEHKVITVHQGADLLRERLDSGACALFCACHMMPPCRCSHLGGAS